MNLNYYECEHCHWVFTSGPIMQVGTECPRCKRPNEFGIAYFGFPGPDTLLDLIRQLYPPEAQIQILRGEKSKDDFRAARLAIVVIFVTMGEVALNQLLRTQMYQLKLPKRVQEHLFDSAQGIRRRTEQLFQVLMNIKWQTAVKRASATAGKNFLVTFRLYEDVRDRRNKFLHAANEFAIPEDMPEQCLAAIPDLLQLFVTLHNNLIASEYDLVT